VYDDADQVSSITDQKGSTTYASFAYTRNNANQVHTESDTGVPGSNQTYSYNQLNQLTGTSSGSYGYDSANNPTSLASGTNQSFNQANELCSSATAPDASCSSPPSGATAFTYNAQGERTSTVGPQGAATSTSTFNQAGELTGITPGVNASSFTQVTPTRVCDTRSGNPSGLSGIANQCNASTLTTAGQVLHVQLSGTSMPVPTSASAVVFNLTAVDSSTSGATSLTVFPTGASEPDTSNLNISHGAIVNNQVTVGLGTNGSGAASINVESNQTNIVDVIVDVVGYYTSGTSGSTYVPVTPTRICDTRAGNPSGLSSPYTQCNGGSGNPGAPIIAGGTLTVQAAGTGFPKPVGATAVVVDVTAVTPSSATFLTAYDGSTRPAVSSLNAPAGGIVDKEVTIPISTSTGKFMLYNASGTTNVVVDIEGYFTGTTSNLYSPVTPQRICDTRASNPSGLSGADAQCNGSGNAGTTLSAGSAHAVQVAGIAGVPSSATAVVINLTAVNESTANWMEAYAAGITRPNSAQLNFGASQVVSNEVTVSVGSSGDIDLYIGSGTSDAIVDIVGFYSAQPSLPPASTYSYNGNGQRMSKTVGGTAEAFVWDNTSSVPALLADGSTSFVYGESGLPLEQISGTTVYYFDQDQLGSTRVLTNSSGNVSSTFTFDPYGNETGSTGTVTTPLLFAGEYRDAESNYYYLQNRYYDPSTTQFISIDPLVGETLSSYGYVENSPLNGTDPTGLCWLGFGAVCDAIHGAAGTIRDTGLVVSGTLVVMGVDSIATAVAIAGLPEDLADAPAELGPLGSVVAAGNLIGMGMIASGLHVQLPKDVKHMEEPGPFDTYRHTILASYLRSLYQCA